MGEMCLYASGSGITVLPDLRERTATSCQQGDGNCRGPNTDKVSQLKSFLGQLNYYGRFLPDLATLLAPLYELPESTRRWSWGKRQSRAFEQAKNELTIFSLLTHIDPKKPVLLSCDASPYGVGAVLSHRMKDGSEQPIAFVSRTKKYVQLDKEALVIVSGVKRFHQYLYGQNSPSCPTTKPYSICWVRQREFPLWHLHVSKDGLSSLVLTSTPLVTNLETRTQMQTPSAVCLFAITQRMFLCRRNGPSI